MVGENEKNNSKMNKMKIIISKIKIKQIGFIKMFIRNSLEIYHIRNMQVHHSQWPRNGV
jgi:hypothetical protein